MEKNKYFYGEHFEHLGYLWDGIYGKAENFTEEQFDNTIKKSSNRKDCLIINYNTNEGAL